MLIVLAYPAGVALLTIVLMPKSVRPLSDFPGAQAVAATREPDARERDAVPGPAGLAAWAERSQVIPAMLAVCLAFWLYHHFVTKGHSLDLNAMNTMLLMVGLLLHRTVASFSKAIQSTVQVCWPIVVLYHLYGGVAGLLQYTTVGEGFAGLFASVSTPLTFPLLTAIGSSIVAVFVPSSGGQWVVQGYVTAKAAEAVGTTVQRGLLSVGVGDHMGNFLSPFWPVVTAGIARVDFRVFFGYGVIFSCSGSSWAWRSSPSCRDLATPEPSSIKHLRLAVVGDELGEQPHPVHLPVEGLGIRRLQLQLQALPFVPLHVVDPPGNRTFLVVQLPFHRHGQHLGQPIWGSPT